MERLTTINSDLLFDQYRRDCRYLKNLSLRTIESYEFVYLKYRRFSKAALPTKVLLKEFVIHLVQHGHSPSGVNTLIKSINPFLTWLHEEGHIPERLCVKRMRAPEVIRTTFTDSQLAALLTWPPRTPHERILHAIIIVIADTGLRIDEVLSLQRANLDLDRLYMQVRGKGSKERIVPITKECRKVLRGILTTHENELVFPSRGGTKLGYDTLRRDFELVQIRVGIDPKAIFGAFHALRRAFATNYLAQGGKEIHLQKILGHANLQQTSKYVVVQKETLQRETERLSPLNRVR